MTSEPRDDLGTVVTVPAKVSRVVSLVPSLTESVAATAPGLLVGATRYCTHPQGLDVVRVGGTKNPDVPAIIALSPDVVLANEEENRPDDIRSLRSAGLCVWVTAPRTVPQALASLSVMLTSACGLEVEPDWLIQARRLWTGRERTEARRVAVPIWRRPWMVIGRGTFAGDLLARCGGVNVFARHADRYPRVSLAEIRAAAPERIVLPDEPYAFSADDGPEAFPGLDCRLVSGRLLTWYGPSLVEAARLTDVVLPS